MLATMPLSEYYQWMVLEQVEPFGEVAEYLRAGIITAMIANVNRGKDQPAFTPQDFMPVTMKPPVKYQDAKTHKTLLMALMERQNAIVKARGGSAGRNSGH